MNLTRMRAMSGGGFAGSVRWTLNKYKDVLYFADQDVLNAIFGRAPWYATLECFYVYVMPISAVYLEKRNKKIFR